MTEQQKPNGEQIAAAVGNSEQSKLLHQQRELIGTGGGSSSFPAADAGSAEPFHEQTRAHAGFKRRCGTFSSLLGLTASAAVLSWRRTESGLCHLYEHDTLGFFQRYLITPLLIPSAMGISFVISRSCWFESEFRSRERARESWELENFRDGEINEMVAIYMSRGLTEKQARELVAITSSRDDFFVDSMMTDELGFAPTPPPNLKEAAVGALIAFASFLGCGIIPLAAANKFDSFAKRKCSWVPEACLAVTTLGISWLQSSMLLRTYTASRDRVSSIAANAGFIAAVYSSAHITCRSSW